MKAIRILLADDHALVRAGTRKLLEGVPDFSVVAEAGDGLEALDLIGRHRPDVALVDISMNGLNGLDLCSRASREFPNVRMLILSMHKVEEYVVRALRAGAAGYVLKDAPLSELIAAVREAAQGRTHFGPWASRQTFTEYLRRTGCEADLLEQLTPRQREVLQLIAGGHSTKAIADILHISVKTAETHRTQLMDRLDLHKATDLVRFAVRVGVATATH
jgi:DNA-binding NarL/FixJ family response regulator